MRQYVRTHKAWLLFFSFLAFTLFAGLFPSTVHGQEDAAASLSEEDQACMACHAEAMEGKDAVHLQALQASPHKDTTCQSCHVEITETPHTPEMVKARVDCAMCHTEQADAMAKSVHANPDKVAGDHPTCTSCHAPNDPHGIVRVASWPRNARLEGCSKCHAQEDRMARYGVDTDAVPSYNESFHGKAVLRFGKENAAGCADCHGAHDVLAPSNEQAPTHPNNVAATCGTSGCHEGAKLNFAMSGANHLRLKMKTSPLLSTVFFFFRALLFGMVAFLMLGVALDLRMRLMSEHVPPAGRPITLLVALSFLSMATALVLLTLGVRGSGITWILALVFLLAAFVVYWMKPKPRKLHHEQKQYLRISKTLRWQHGLLAVSFTMLAFTGLPMRFASAPLLGKVYLLFGGLDGGRIVHRTFAVILIAAWVWHFIYLIDRWRRRGFSFKSWSMLPNKKDVQDFIHVSKYYLGMRRDEPKYDRFQFREKMDYLAEYWGMPIMVLSGMVLWFPIYWGNRLPDVAIGMAYIAHSYEATLAFLAIVTWHMYNAHFSPDAFPMSPTWYTGTKSREEMEREHPLELERLEAEEASGEA